MLLQGRHAEEAHLVAPLVAVMLRGRVSEGASVATEVAYLPVEEGF
jgi:hypothetical protein